MRKTIGFVTAVVAVGLFLSGCTTVDVREGPGPGVRVRDSRAPQAGIRMNSVAIIDESLQKWDGKVFDPPWSSIFQAGPKERDKRSKIAVESTNSRRTPTGTLEVWAVLRNRTDFPLQIEGRTQFFNRDQAPIEGPTAWQRVHLPPNAVATYQEFSTKIEEIAFYYIEIREGR
jgi:uncharacterized protein YceK